MTFYMFSRSSALLRPTFFNYKLIFMNSCPSNLVLQLGSSTGVVKNYDSVYVMANAYVESGTRIAKSSQSGLNLLLLTIASVRLINKRLAPHCCLHRPMNLIFPVRHLSKSASGIHFNLPPLPMPAYLSREDKKDFSAFYETTLCRRYAAMPLIIKANVGYTFPHPPALDAPRAV